MIRKYTKGAILLGVILSMGFTSCGVFNTNKYKSPEVDTQCLFRGEDPTDTTSIANIPWRGYFADPALQALIDEGLNNNYDLQIAVTRIQQAEASLYVAKSAYFPTVALAGQVDHTRRSVSNSGREKILGYAGDTKYSLGVVVQWEADIWGKLNSKSKAQYAQYVGTHAYRNLVQTSLIANIATSYYSLLALDEQLKVTKETIGLLEESTKTIDAMMQAGIPGINRAAVKQSEGLLYSTKVSVPGLEMQINQLENSLSLMLGRKPGSIARTSIDSQIIPSQLAFGVPAQMLAKRSDVLQAEMAFRSAFEMKNAAQRSLYPSITLTSGMVGFATVNTVSQFFKPENLLANIVGGLTQPLFAGNQLRGQLKVAKAQQQEALLTFEKTVLAASQEVSNILYTFDASLRKNDDRTKQVESLSIAVSDTKKLLINGETDYTAVLQAEQGLLQAQLGQVSDKLEQLQATVNLYRALGGGVE
jgi:NodT family efflux transporter outer membrane factor (OMF) lipoprotein